MIAASVSASVRMVVLLMQVKLLNFAKTKKGCGKEEGGRREEE
jgi:hypothetical protein